MSEKYRLTKDPVDYGSPPFPIPPYCVERKVGWLLGWTLVTRISDPEQFREIAEQDAFNRNFEPRYLTLQT